MVQKNNINSNKPKTQPAQHNKSQNQSGNQKPKLNNRRENNNRPNNQKNSRSEFQKKAGARYISENRAARIITPKREETIDDIKMDIEKLEKDIQFEIKQIQSVKLGL